MPKATDTDEGLKRLGGGRWQTRDERFTIEPQSGTWVVVDAEQTDELGLALVRGPFGSLGAAKRRSPGRAGRNRPSLATAGAGGEAARRPGGPRTRSRDLEVHGKGSGPRRQDRETGEGRQA